MQLINHYDPDVGDSLVMCSTQYCLGYSILPQARLLLVITPDLESHLIITLSLVAGQTNVITRSGRLELISYHLL